MPKTANAGVPVSYLLPNPPKIKVVWSATNYQGRLILLQKDLQVVVKLKASVRKIVLFIDTCWEEVVVVGDYGGSARCMMVQEGWWSRLKMSSERMNKVTMTTHASRCQFPTLWSWHFRLSIAVVPVLPSDHFRVAIVQ